MTREPGGSPEVDKVREMEEDRFRRRLLAVEREVERLRARVRVLGIGMIAALVLAAVAAFNPHLLALGGDAVELDVLRAKQIVLDDADGTPRGEWRVDEEGNSRLTLLDRQSRTRLSFAVLSDGYPGLSLLNVNGQRRGGLALLPDESVNLTFADASGNARTVLGLARSDASQLLFIDADLVPRVALGLDGSGVAILDLPETGEPEVSEGGGR